MRQLSELFKATQAKPRLFIVDDQPQVIRILHELFKDDCEVFMCTQPVEAVNKCREIKPDLILLDLVMPEMDGYQVCKLIKNDNELSDIPIIFVTASFDQMDEVKGFEMGAVDFIHKPVNPVITRARVNTHLRLKRQSDLLKSMALIDGLTGIANRRNFESTIQIDWLQCAREKTPLSLLLMDIDQFKLFNDYYGHLAGDSCLQKVAKSLANTLNRPYDLVARYGGEEFAFILPRTDKQGAECLAKSVSSNLAELAIPHTASSTGLVTLSIGVATTVPSHKVSPDVLIHEADKVLYQAKENGRNQFLSMQFDCLRV